MKNYKEIDSENEVFILNILGNTNLEHVIRFTFVSDDEATDVVKLTKMNPLQKFVSKGIDLVVTLNEEIFDRLDVKMQSLIIKEAIHSINYNSEKDTITLQTADIVTYSDFLEHVEIVDYIRTVETIKSIKDQLKEANSKSKSK